MDMQLGGLAGTCVRVGGSDPSSTCIIVACVGSDSMCYFLMDLVDVDVAW